jgi:flavin reductase (DIM6/NTAB) family NADH-FMN oxidoreductase RutF
LEQLQKGAFLTVKANGKVNTMTIAWGSLGFIWNKHIFTTLVRYSRYTHEIIDKAQDFTVSFPLNNDMGKELGICGTKSGRDIDKFNECKLVMRRGEKVNSPIIDNCTLHIECKIVYKQGMDKKNLSVVIQENSYADEDYHVMYFGEILKAYIREN